MATVAVDAGTSMIKAVVFDDTGAEVALARQPTEVRRPRPGWAEQDMTAVWTAVAAAVRSALATVDLPATAVTSLAITAQGDGCWLVDAAGEPTGPAILWSDGRAADIVADWRRAGVTERAFRINGSLGFSGLPHAILSWLAEHDPDRVDRSATALYCGGWLFFRCTGELGVDLSDASVPFLDPRRGAYSPELLDLFGLRWAAHLLPEIRPPGARSAPLTEHAAAELGLPAGLPVVLAAYDVAATALGVGATDPGQACTILGTTLCTEVVRERVDTSGAPAGLTIKLDTGGDVLRAFPTLAGTEVLDWAATVLGLDHPRDLAELAGRAEPGAHGLTFLPYLSPAGERAPFLNPHARGTFWGLSLEHGRAEIARAVFEGLTMVIRDCLAATGAAATELRVCGGGASSAMWCQLIADVVGVPTVRSADTEVGAKGAMLTALVATGAEPGYSTAARHRVRVTGGYEPDRARVARYADQYERFRALRDHSTPGWAQQTERDA